MPTPPRQSSPIETLATLTFGAGGNSLPHQRHGFGDPEDGFTWSTGKSSELVLHVPPPPDGTAFDHLLELRLNPMVAPDVLASQLLRVSVNGQEIGEDSLVGEGTVGYWIPSRALRPDGQLVVTLRHPGAVSPQSLGFGEDRRVLGYMLRSIAVLRVSRRPDAAITALPPFQVPLPRDQMGAAITAAIGLDPRSLALCFESLGHNCEFGLVQTHVGADPLGLLRFTSITLEHLLMGLRVGFAGTGEDLRVRTFPVGDGRHEYMLQDDRFHITVHTFRTTDEISLDDIMEEHRRRLKFMRRQFLSFLKTGQRLFVFQRPGQITPSQARALLIQLRNFGPNALLYVDQSPGLPCGAVEQLEHGLFHGKLDWMAQANEVGKMDLASWLSICVNAWRLWQAGRAL